MLWDLFLNHKGRIIHKWMHYFPIYENHFSEYVNKPLTFIEIGCGQGGSLQLWKKYFGPYAQIIGIDIQPHCKTFEEEQIQVRIGNQSDTNFLKQVLNEFGTPDIILDDGSHIMQDQITSFNFLYPKIKENGLYMAEDLHTSYWQEFGGGLKKEGTFIEKCKNLIDELNAEHIPLNDTFSKSTLSMHIYDSIIAFKKGKSGRKYADTFPK